MVQKSSKIDDAKIAIKSLGVNIQNYRSLWHRFPRLSLLVVTLPVLFLNSDRQSLLSYDEGYYADQARWILETGDWLTPAWWGQAVYDRTIGLQWLIALSYQLFGLNEFSVRLPSAIACIASVLLTYEIGKILFDDKIAWLGAAILMLMAVWVIEAHTGHQNTLLVAVELLGIWALLQITDAQSNKLSSISKSTKINWGWGVIAGTTFGLAFLIKGFMVVVPVVALLPYIISQQRYRKLISNPGIYLGLILGLIPPGLWLVLSCYKYGGITPVKDLVEKILFLSKTDTYNPGPFYYFWNVPANIFPWGLFSVIGAVVVWRRLLPKINYSILSLTLGYPISLFILISLFRTQTPYYPMQFLPFMALLAATAFVYFTQISQHQYIKSYRLFTWLSYAFSGLGIILAIAGVLVIFNSQLWGLIITSEISKYGLAAIILGCGWTTIIILWNRWQSPSIPYWLASWFIPAWMTMIIFGLQGSMLDKSPEFKSSFYQLIKASNVSNQPINLSIDTVSTKKISTPTSPDRVLTGEELKTLILLTFYTPHLGTQVHSFIDLPTQSYAWTLSIAPELATKTRILGEMQGWKLIQKIGQ